MNEFLPFHAWCPAVNPANVVYDFFLLRFYSWCKCIGVLISYQYEPGKQKINSTWPRLRIEPATFAFLERRFTFWATRPNWEGYYLFTCDVNDMNEFLPFHAWWNQYTYTFTSRLLESQEKKNHIQHSLD